MAIQPEHVVRQLRQPGPPPAAEPETDATLLRRFGRQRDEAAFAALVARYGRLVLGVCRRVLGDAHAAEDTAQATFLVLARKAASIRRPDTLAAWLHGTARHLALSQRRGQKRRQGREARGFNQSRRPLSNPLDELAARELLEILDEEVQHLPAAYRAPVLLCCVEGHTQEEAARLLGWSAGSVKGRLERGRERLHARMVERGLMLSMALALVEVCREAAADLPAPWSEATVQGGLAFAAGGDPALAGVSADVATLTAGALRIAGGTSLKIMAGLVVATGVVFAAGILARARMLSEPPPREQARPVGALQGQQQARSDRFGDPLPAQAVARMGSGRLRHGYISRLVFAPDGKSVVTAGGTHLCSWDVKTGGLRYRVAIPPNWTPIWPLGLAVSGDGLVILCADQDQSVTLQVFDPESGKPRRRLPIKDRIARGRPLALAPDGSRLAFFHDKRIGVYDAATGQETAHIPAAKTLLADLAFSHDGKTLAVWDQTDTVRLHDARDGRVVCELKRAGDKVNRLVFSPDGRSLASIASGPTKDWAPRPIGIWDLATGKERHRLVTEPGTLGWAAFSPDGRHLVFGSVGGANLVLWDLHAEKEERRLPMSDSVNQAVFSPDGKVLAALSAWGTVYLWDVATGRLLPASPDPAVGSINHLQFSRDGKRLLGMASGPGTCQVTWEPTTGREVRRSAPVAGKWGVALAPDESLVAGTNLDGAVWLWDAATGRPMRQLGKHDGRVYCILFTSDGRRAISSGYDHKIRVWDTAGGERQQLAGRGAVTSCLAVSPDGRWLASATDMRGPGGNFEVYLWDLTTGQESAHMEMAPETSAFGVAFSPDSRLLAASTGAFGVAPSRVHVWDVGSGREWRRFNGPKTILACAAFSPDGRTLATGCEDGSLILWELATGHQRHRFVGHEQWIHSLAFSPDGRLLAASSNEAPIYVWDVIGTWERPAQEPTPAEWERAWADLGGADAEAAFHAVRRLANAPGTAIPFLRGHLRAVPPPDRRRLDRLAAALESESFAERERAMKEFAELAELAGPVLRGRLAAKPTLETRRRLQELLQKLDEPIMRPELRRAVRAVEAVEYVATPDARDLLRLWARGAPGAWLTREAQAALARLEKRPGK